MRVAPCFPRLSHTSDMKFGLIMIIVVNLIYIAQFDTNGILTVLYIAIQYIQIHETVIFIHIYMPVHKHIHRYMYKYISTDIVTRLPIL